VARSSSSAFLSQCQVSKLEPARALFHGPVLAFHFRRAAQDRLNFEDEFRDLHWDAHVAEVFRMPKSTRFVRYRTYCMFLVRITNQSCSVSPAADWIARMSNSGWSVDLTIAWAYSRTRDSSPARQMITNGRLGLACFASLAS